MSQSKRWYAGDPYWEKEKPIEAWTRKVCLFYYPEAGKLQVGVALRDRETGERKRVKVVTLDKEDLTTHPEALQLLERVLQDWT
ncbi:MAG: hypothetical protein ACPLPR_03380 [Bacillota bacterium]